MLNARSSHALTAEKFLSLTVEPLGRKEVAYLRFTFRDPRDVKAPLGWYLLTAACSEIEYQLGRNDVVFRNVLDRLPP